MIKSRSNRPVVQLRRWQAVVTLVCCPSFESSSTSVTRCTDLFFKRLFLHCRPLQINSELRTWTRMINLAQCLYCSSASSVYLVFSTDGQSPTLWLLYILSLSSRAASYSDRGRDVCMTLVKPHQAASQSCYFLVTWQLDLFFKLTSTVEPGISSDRTFPYLCFEIPPDSLGSLSSWLSAQVCWAQSRTSAYAVG